MKIISTKVIGDATEITVTKRYKRGRKVLASEVTNAKVGSKAYKQAIIRCCGRAGLPIQDKGG